MIEHLIPGAAAYFHRAKKPLTGAAIQKLFTTLREDAVGQNLFRRDRAVRNGARYSAIAFPMERTPSFLDEASHVRDKVHGFAMVVEDNGYIAVFKSGLDIPTWFKAEFLGRLGNARVERAVATADATFEQISLRAMSTSKLNLRSKSLEAADLQNAVPMSNASRFLTRRFAVKRGDERYAATPSTGRISKRAVKVTYGLAVDWARTVFTALSDDAAATAPFLANFARPVDLETIPAGVSPTLLGVEVPALAERLMDERPVMRLITKAEGEEYRALTDAEAQAALDALDQQFTIEINDDAFVIHGADGDEMGELKRGKTRISLSKLNHPAIDGVYIERADAQLGQDDDKTQLRRYIDRENLFLVMFSDVSLVYADGELFRDQALVGGGAKFMAHLVSEPILAGATDEKGEFTNAHTEFDADSVFGQVVTAIAAGEDILLCDDLDNEWADFIGLTTSMTPPSISFYHAKHGVLSIGASPFHGAVGQAEKNLGNLPLPVHSMPAKYAGWANTYNNKGAQTQIPRILRGGPIADIQAQVDALRLSPDVIKRVLIVTSSLSRAQVQAQFDAAANGGQPSVYFVQLYWLLMAYFDACTEVNAVGYVVCQP